MREWGARVARASIRGRTRAWVQATATTLATLAKRSGVFEIGTTAALLIFIAPMSHACAQAQVSPAKLLPLAREQIALFQQFGLAPIMLP
jgi:hypothetical protein